MTYISKKEVIRIIKEHIDKGEKCMEQSNSDDEQDIYKFWDGYHNCAENILNEIEDIYEIEDI